MSDRGPALDGQIDRLRLLSVFASPRTWGDRVPPPHWAEDSPPPLPPLNLEHEWALLREAIDLARDPVQGVLTHWAVVRCYPQWEQSLSLMLRIGYHVVHFCCHGDKHGLYLEDEEGFPLFFSANELAQQLGNVDLVYLNACDSIEVGQILIKHGVRCVIATKSPVESKTAQKFCSSFYIKLARGMNVAEAFQRAQKEVPAAIAFDILQKDPSCPWKPTLAPTPGVPLFFPYTPYNRYFPDGLADGFVGRRDVLQRIGEWVRAPGRKYAALSGIGGAGKTSLAVKAALHFGQRFNYLAFASARGKPTFGCKDVLEALRLAQRGQPGDEPELENQVDAIAARLRRGKVLLILDNQESVDSDETELLKAALEGVGAECGSKVLFTIRPPDHGSLTGLVPAEDRIRVQGLHSADALSIIYQAWSLAGGTKNSPIERVNAEEAEELERLRIAAGLPASCLLCWARDLNTLAELVFGIPLLLKAAGALAAQYGYAAAKAELTNWDVGSIGEDMDQLIGTMVDRLQKSAPAAVDLLYAMLPFDGDASEQELRYVTFGDDTEPDGRSMVFRKKYLAPAVSSSLLQERKRRYELDPPVRAYLANRAVQTREPRASLAKLRLRHAKAFLAVARQIAPATVEREWKNISAALIWLSYQVPQDDEATGPDEAAEILVQYIVRLHEILRHRESLYRTEWLEAARWAARRTKYLGSSAMLGEALAVEAMGDIHVLQKRTDLATETYKEAVNIYKKVQEERGAQAGQARAYARLGDLAWDKQSAVPSTKPESRTDKELDQMFFYYGEAAQLYERVADKDRLAYCLERTAWLHKLCGEETGAEACFAQVRQLRESLGQRPESV